MTEQQQQPDEYPAHWTPWLTPADANPIAETTEDTTAYPAHWRV